MGWEGGPAAWGLSAALSAILGAASPAAHSQPKYSCSIPCRGEHSPPPVQRLKFQLPSSPQWDFWLLLGAPLISQAHYAPAFPQTGSTFPMAPLCPPPTISPRPTALLESFGAQPHLSLWPLGTPTRIKMGLLRPPA